MSSNNPPIPPQTWLKMVASAPKKPLKDLTNAEVANSDIRTKEQAMDFLISKDYVDPGNSINLQILAHVLSQLVSTAFKMPKALTDGIAAIAILIDDLVTQQLINDVVTAVKTQLQEHLDSFTSNIEVMRDTVEHITDAAKDFTGKINNINDGFQESAEQLAQTTQELTE